MADYGETVLQGMQVGSSIYSRGAELALRRQQLESERALRQMQQEHIAQQMQLSIQKEQDKIQEQADFAKAHTSFLHDISPVVDLDPASPNGVVPNPNAMPMDKAVLKNFSGPMAKWHPDKFGSFLDDAAMLPYRQAAAQKAADWKTVETLKEQGRTDRGQARFDLGMMNLDERKAHDMALEDARNRGLDEREAHNAALEAASSIREKGLNDRFNRKLDFEAKMGLAKPGTVEWDLKVKNDELQKREIAARTLRDSILRSPNFSESEKTEAGTVFNRTTRRISDDRDELIKRWSARISDRKGSSTTPTASGTRVKVSKGGKVFTVPQEQLDEAISQGYTEVK